MKCYCYLFGLCLPLFVFTAEPSADTESLGVEAVSPVEDLMREHGLLDRLLLIYEEIIRRIDAKQSVPGPSLRQSAELMRRFIEDYHERLEEEYLIPKFQQAQIMIEVMQEILLQHRRRRLLTEEILARGSDENLKDPVQQKRIKELLLLFVRMYRPHAAREDTLVFPAFKKLVSLKEYDRLGVLFEEKEDSLFGKDGFFHVVSAVAILEKTLGIYNLAEFTPPKPL